MSANINYFSAYNDHPGEEPPTNLAASQTGFGTVLVSWDAPPTGGERYRVTADPGGVIVDSSVSPRNISIPQPGVYSIQVMTLSHQCLPGTAGPVNITIRGEN